VPKQLPAPGRRAFVERVAEQFRQLVDDLAYDRGITRPSQPAVARLLNRSQSYVQTRYAGLAAIDTEILDAYALLLDTEGSEMLEMLAKRVRGLTDAEALDTLAVLSVTGGAYALAARRRAPVGSESGGTN
jgi:hypothetical protein